MLCNAGGVIVSYFEWVQDLQSFFWTEAEVNDKLYRQLEVAYQQVTQMARKKKLYMRDAALALGISQDRPGQTSPRPVPVKMRDGSVLRQPWIATYDRCVF